MILVDVNVVEDTLERRKGEVGANIIVTRNKRHFRGFEKEIKVQSPEEFLKEWRRNRSASVGAR